MKIKISTVIDIPDDVLLPEHEFPSAVEYIADMITQYVENKHRVDAMTWLVKAKRDATSTEYSIFKFHDGCANACGKLKWEYEEVK